jgi:hypothetical protein
MLQFIAGTIVGAAMLIGLSCLWGYSEWRARMTLEYRVGRMWKHLSCGKGYLGCDGGPDCDWDHK